MKKYFLSKNGKTLGPFEKAEIEYKVTNGEVTASDYIFDDELDEWVHMFHFKPLVQLFHDEKPTGNPMQEQSSESSEELSFQHDEADKPMKRPVAQVLRDNFEDIEWFCLKGENKFGPFTYKDMVRMLQQKIIFEFDYAWYAGMKNWVRIAELSAFSEQSIKRLQKTTMPEIEKVFFRRKYMRRSFDGTIVAHDNKCLWKGQATELSAGGAGVMMSNSMIPPGTKLYLHFKPTGRMPAFNAVCEVVSKKYNGEIDNSSKLCKYGLKFLSLNGKTREKIMGYTESSIEKSMTA